MPKIYGIYARSQVGNSIGIGFTAHLAALIRQFITEHPRFNGRGLIVSQIVTVDEENRYTVNVLNWETFLTFKNAQELKKYLGE